MIDDLIKAPAFRRFFPPVAGVIFIAVFVSLALWQLERATEKKALLSLFEGDAPYVRVSDYVALKEFDRIKLDGEFLTNRQILIDNIVRDGRPGYYVITPFKPNSVDPLLLINRGWLPKPITGADTPDIGFDSGLRTIRGLVGHLPRVAIRPGDAFANAGDWPRVAVYPSVDEIADELGAAISPPVLLLAPEEEDGFVRQWQPNLSGPMTHYGYAFQWFAMAATLLALMVWHMRKRRNDG